MILWLKLLSLLFLLLLILLFIWWSPEISDDIPTIHAVCQTDKNCGSNLSCDTQFNRCKQKIEGPCSSDIDCESGLFCSNWKCSNFITDDNDITTTNTMNAKKEVRWNEVNEIFFV